MKKEEMEVSSKNNKITVGILAHVDSGKTTLAEAMLYSSGVLSSPGRVDHQDAFLDTKGIERERGITVFSKIARIKKENKEWILLDTPGHADFSAEMERALSVLDYGILVINGSDGVRAHTKTLWKLLDFYNIPVFIFVNKMDQEGAVKEALLTEIKKELSSSAVSFNQKPNALWEELAVIKAEFLDQYLAEDTIEITEIQEAVRNREVFPCFFGSALKIEGVNELTAGMEEYMISKSYPEEFGAKVYKIYRDQNQRITEMKITGGILENKSVIQGEKINEIRIYSGEEYESVQQVYPGEICGVVGLQSTFPGEGLGFEEDTTHPLLTPVMTYGVHIDENANSNDLLEALKVLEEEMPELRVDYFSETGEISIHVMGEILMEILKEVLKERFNLSVHFDQGSIIYKEKIKDASIGIGHFEPLRHYAEVQLLLEPGERGSGICVEPGKSIEKINTREQNHILEILKKESFRGVLLGGELTDTKITLLEGKSHEKHTEGGDFREAAVRAVRQGLMMGESEILEPYYKVQIEIPIEYYGRVLTDLTRLKGEDINSEQKEEKAVFSADVPVSLMRDYITEVQSFTKGAGRVQLEFSGYGSCHDAEEVLRKSSYNPLRDLEQPGGSVFCSQGAGFTVPWDQVYDYAHIPPKIEKKREEEQINPQRPSFIVDEEAIEKILQDTFYSNKRESRKARKKPKKDYYLGKENYKAKEEVIIVDGYNMIHSWDELKGLPREDLEASRIKLLDILSNYQGLTQKKIMVVFDAYKVKGIYRKEDFDFMEVVYTKEGETADQFIERYIRDIGKDTLVRVATSDGTEQVVVRGAGGLIISAKDFREEVIRTYEEGLKEYREKNPNIGDHPFDSLI